MIFKGLDADDNWDDDDADDVYPRIDRLTDAWLEGKDVSIYVRASEDVEFEEPYLFYRDINEEDSWNL